MVPLSWYLILAAVLFAIGLYGVLARRHVIAVLMALELMLNAVNLNLVAMARYLETDAVTGNSFALFVYALAAAETAVGLALIIAIWRNREVILTDKMKLLKG